MHSSLRCAGTCIGPCLVHSGYSGKQTDFEVRLSHSFPDDQKTVVNRKVTRLFP